MHRHGYKGRKFNREQDQRRALMKSLADSLIEHGSIETTLPKAKELRPYVEKLITKAKKGDLHNRRLLMTRLQTDANTHKLVDEIAPKLTERTSGYLRIERTRLRRGDSAQMARIEFVDDISGQPVSATTSSATTTSGTPANAEEATTSTTKKSAPSKKASTQKKAEA